MRKKSSGFTLIEAVLILFLFGLITSPGVFNNIAKAVHTGSDMMNFVCGNDSFVQFLTDRALDNQH